MLVSLRGKKEAKTFFEFFELKQYSSNILVIFPATFKRGYDIPCSDEVP